MRRRRRLVLPVVALIAAGVPGTASAVDPPWWATGFPVEHPQPVTGPDAAKLALVGAPGIFSDPQGDSGGAPDLRETGIAVDDAGVLRVLVEMGTSALGDGEFAMTYIDGDHDGATTSSTSDFGVAFVGSTFGQKGIGLARWDGTTFTDVPVPSLHGAVLDDTTVAWSALLSELGLRPGSKIGVRFATLKRGVYGDEFDLSPAAGAPPFGFAIPGGTIELTSPPPLRITGLGLRRSGRDLRVRLAWGGGATGQRAAWTLRLRARGTTKTLRGVASIARPLTRTVRLPLAWAGATVQVRATLRRGTHTVAMTRSVQG